MRVVLPSSSVSYSTKECGSNRRHGLPLCSSLVSPAEAGRWRTGHPRTQEAQEAVLQSGRDIVVAQGTCRTDSGAIGVEVSEAVLTGTQVLLEDSQGLGRQCVSDLLDEERCDLLAR